MKHAIDRSELSRRLLTLAVDMDVALSLAEADLLVGHLELVLRANERLNLTRIVDPEGALRLHVLDSVAAVPEVLASADGRYADIGSGAGYPGIPIASSNLHS